MAAQETAKRRDSGLKFFAMIIAAAIALTVCDAFAARGRGGGISGDYSLTFFGAYANATQEQMNTLITRANARAGDGPISNGQLTGGYEFGGAFAFRFSGTMYELQFRPSYFWQSSKGSGAGGNFEYGITAWTFFPIFRLYPLENDFMKFYMQLGLGYGSISGKIKEGSPEVDFSGSTFGSLAGLGTQFCFTGSHCMNIEANYRYMNVERNVPSSAGDFSGKGNSVSSPPTNPEVEIDNADLQTRLSGLIFVMGYTYNF